MLTVYVFTVSSCVWVRNGVEVLKRPRSSCYVVPLSWCRHRFRKCAFRWFLLYNYITMHVEKNIKKTFYLQTNISYRLYLRFHWRDFPATSCLTPYRFSLLTIQFCLRSVNNQGHFTRGTKYLRSCVLSSIGGIFLQRRTAHSSHMRYKHCQFGCDWSIIKGTVLVEESKFLSISRLQLEGFS